MRKDIKFSIETHDVVLDNVSDIESFPFVIISEGDTSVNAQITVPHTYNFNKLWAGGIVCEIPYTPIYKPMYISVKRLYSTEDEQYLINPTNNDNYFLVKGMGYSQLPYQIVMSKYILLNSDFKYKIVFDKSLGIAYIYSAYNTDFSIVNANNQNKNMLLECGPSNNYRYPTSGVGLAKYIKSNISQTDLANRISSEFANDGVIVTDCQYNFETQDLMVNINEK